MTKIEVHSSRDGYDKNGNFQAADNFFRSCTTLEEFDNAIRDFCAWRDSVDGWPIEDHIHIECHSDNGLWSGILPLTENIALHPFFTLV